MNTRKRQYTQQPPGNNKRRRTLRRNWLDLPRDVLILIFIKVGVVDLVFNARKVCLLWRQVAREPMIYQSLNFEGIGVHISRYHEPIFEDFAMKAIDKCGGRVTHLCFNDYFCINRVLSHLQNMYSLKWLKSLRVGPNAYLTEEKLEQICRQAPLLEVFDVDFARFPINAVLGISPKLKSFRLCKRIKCISFDKEVEAIVKSVPQLRSLTLASSLLTNKGLQVLLDGCPNLEFLDFRECYNANIKKSLLRKCASRLRCCWFPDQTSWKIVAVQEFLTLIRHLLLALIERLSICQKRTAIWQILGSF